MAIRTDKEVDQLYDKLHNLTYRQLAALRDRLTGLLLRMAAMMDAMAEEEWDERESQWLAAEYEELAAQQKKADAWEAYVPEGLPKPIEWEKYVSDDFEDWADRMEAEDPNF